MLLLFFCCCWFVLYIRIYENDVSQQVGWLDQLYSSCWLSLISFSCLCFPSFPVLLLLLQWMPLRSTSLSFSAHRRKSHQHQTLAHTQLCIYLPLLFQLLLSLDVSFVSWLVPSTFSRYSFDSIFIWFSFKTLFLLLRMEERATALFFFFSLRLFRTPQTREWFLFFVFFLLDSQQQQQHLKGEMKSIKQLCIYIFSTRSAGTHT